MKPIDAVVGLSEWYIDGLYGLKNYNKYVFETQVLKEGLVDYSKTRRENTANYYLTPSGSVFTQDPYDPKPVPSGSIAVIKFHGIMFAEEAMCSYGVGYFTEQIRKADGDPNIKGIILKVHSGGGEATAGVMLMNAVKETRKPLIVHGDYMASGAVLGTLYADEIILSSNMVQMGSIGVMMDINMKILKKIRKDYKSLYSTKSNRKNEEFRELVENNNFDPLIKRLTKLDTQFMSEVKKARKHKLQEDHFDEILSGAMFPARKAVEYGMADGIGDLNYVKRRMKFHLKAA